MKYHAMLSKESIQNELPFNPCQLLDFNLLALKDGDSFTGSSDDREILAVILGGKAKFTVAGKEFGVLGERPDVFSGKPYSVYIPAGSDYAIEAQGEVEIALASAPSDEEIEPYVIDPSQIATGAWGGANFKRYYHQILTTAAQPDLPARRLIVGETFTPSGNWSTYPPHKHEEDDLPNEAFHEEMYYFRVDPAEGFGICVYYNDDGEEENFTIRDNSIHMMDKGYHTVVSAPGYTTYYLWFLAGNQRAQAVVNDPVVGWVGETVPTLKKLGL